MSRPFRLRAPAPPGERGSLLHLQYGAGPVEPGALAVPLPLVEGARSERWDGETAATADAGPPALREGGGLLVATWQLAESAEAPLEARIDTIYRQIDDVLGRSADIQAIKLWHYIADLNAGSGPGERYQRFCVARAPHLAGRAVLPAATAIGAPPGSPLTVILLAGRAPVTPIENPRQVPAYHYPSRYSPQGPHFARAMRTAAGQLFVSGTAAVVGHESLHPGDSARQLREIRRNLDALLLAAGGGFVPRAFQVFLRRAAEWPLLRGLWQELFPGEAVLRVVQGDISRAELLVEVEALYDPV